MDDVSGTHLTLIDHSMQAKEEQEDHVWPLCAGQNRCGQSTNDVVWPFYVGQRQKQYAVNAWCKLIDIEANVYRG